MKVLVRTSGGAGRRVRAALVKQRAERMLRALGLSRAELSILVCDDAEIRALNKAYRRKDKATDVLAFAAREARGTIAPASILGDVAISFETASRQAKEKGHSLSFEATFLLAHGLLHLIGFDHRTDAEERRMNARTDALVSAATRGSRASSRGA